MQPVRSFDGAVFTGDAVICRVALLFAAIKKIASKYRRQSFLIERKASLIAWKTRQSGIWQCPGISCKCSGTNASMSAKPRLNYELPTV